MEQSPNSHIEYFLRFGLDDGRHIGNFVPVESISETVQMNAAIARGKKRKIGVNEPFNSIRLTNALLDRNVRSALRKVLPDSFEFKYCILS